MKRKPLTPKARIAAAIKEITSALGEMYPTHYITSREIIRDGGIACIAVGASFFEDDVVMSGFMSRDFAERFDRREIGPRSPEEIAE